MLKIKTKASLFFALQQICKFYFFALPFGPLLLRLFRLCRSICRLPVLILWMALFISPCFSPRSLPQSKIGGPKDGKKVGSFLQSKKGPMQKQSPSFDPPNQRLGEGKLVGSFLLCKKGLPYFLPFLLTFLQSKKGKKVSKKGKKVSKKYASLYAILLSGFACPSPLFSPPIFDWGQRWREGPEGQSKAKGTNQSKKEKWGVGVLPHN